MDKFFSTYENRPRHLKKQSGLTQKVIELKKELQIDDKPKGLSFPMNSLADTPEQMRSLAPEVLQSKCAHWPLRQTNYSADQWIQVFTDGSYMESSKSSRQSMSTILQINGSKSSLMGHT
ncbi:unnamed protein product [Rodentolepis nana]|uniref:RNase H domain-containing protein n=1 Tax=Rodentolepis nana TaxID=102285 RepID=A0A0R3TCA5_RODNA|nr:unnamed protein product [Rodentolepis nana]